MHQVATPPCLWCVARVNRKLSSRRLISSHSLLALFTPFLLQTAYNKKRFYCFSNREPSEEEDEDGFGRDVFNEKPAADEQVLQVDAAVQNKIGKNAVIRTTLGDIHIVLEGERCPRTVENFCVHSRNHYYDNVIFHRVIKGFMIQTGDPLGDGTGGESIWGTSDECN